MTGIVQPPTGYVVDVCRHCGRLAQWPGCEHWQSHEGWTMSVHVSTRIGDRDRLRVAMNAGRGED